MFPYLAALYSCRLSLVYCHWRVYIYGFQAKRFKEDEMGHTSWSSDVNMQFWAMSSRPLMTQVSTGHGSSLWNYVNGWKFFLEMEMQLSIAANLQLGDLFSRAYKDLSLTHVWSLPTFWTPSSTKSLQTLGHDACVRKSFAGRRLMYSQTFPLTCNPTVRIGC